ncbi:MULTISPECIES: flagellar basal body L-ring protein FlgH [Chelativorans]|jgi:flagellar L-ring protein precursor FlgH|uniref:Flagellar L-ring protein n=1 Tax=Chelativorans sp. (strain BNC1) TaxID=266779 RepID=FLGH_CHESB|nr:MULTISPECIES: flagellar basal body L-ring protein FlgH [Chelativorans]Q11LN0.1 RecName: Full=Flagellar L-ring protein; AltName: Full=Basal body L-ring protein; Flags: Precursor [Chelativorans sp. BNC1]
MNKIAGTLFLLAGLAMAGCTTTEELGKPPALSPVGSGAEPTAMQAYHYPDRRQAHVSRYSLWSDRQSRLFTDPRALEVGDILTVVISINDKAKFENESERSRQATRNLGLAGTFAIGSATGSAEADADIGSGTSTVGSGATKRSEDMRLVIAAIVTERLPNGNLRISGTQEVRVNAELRVLTIAGLVRPADIGPNNTISYERIAEARISYGGRGRLTEVQQPPYGQQFLDTVLPF